MTNISTELTISNKIATWIPCRKANISVAIIMQNVCLFVLISPKSDLSGSTGQVLIIYQLLHPLSYIVADTILNPCHSAFIRARVHIYRLIQIEHNLIAHELSDGFLGISVPMPDTIHEFLRPSR